MNFFSLISVEFRKIRRSKILLILLVPVILMWIPSIINTEMNFDTRGIPITPENNFINGFNDFLHHASRYALTDEKDLAGERTAAHTRFPWAVGIVPSP